MKSTSNHSTNNNHSDPQSWAYKLAAFTFASVVVGSLLAQIYQTTTGKGTPSPVLTDTLKSGMLVLSGLLAGSKAAGPTAPQTQDVQVVNKEQDPIPVEEKK